MKNLPIGVKLACGFAIIIFFLLVSGGTAYYNLSNNFELFVQYRSLARHSNLMGGVQTHLLQARMSMKNYLLHNDQQDLDQFASAMQATKDFMEEALKEIQEPQAAPLVQESSKLLAEYNEQFHHVTELQARNAENWHVLNTIGPALEHKLSALMRAADKSGNLSAAYDAGAVLKHLLLGRLYVFKFRQDNSREGADKAKKELHLFAEKLAALSSPQENAGHRDALKELKELYAKYLPAFENMENGFFARNKIVEEKLDKWGPTIANDLESAKDILKNKQDTLGPRLQRQSENAKNIVGGLSLAALVIGLFAGLVITRAIVKPLAAATTFANAVSQGAFETELAVHQKDEVGKICTALDTIRHTISGAANEVEGIVSRVEQGDMQATGDATAFSGGFAALVNGVNTLVKVYTTFLDQLPVGVMALKSNHDVNYLNRTARTMAGVDSYTGKKCGDIFNTDDCNSNNCASDLCMRQRSAADSQTTARTKTGTYDVSYTSIPLITRKGVVAGAAEIVIDQTEIKNAQRTMVSVAEQANQIADRVASASEELSAQVEQISQGAEVQQQRVAETATAMEEMTATVLEVAKNATEATSESNSAKEKAEEGAHLVDNVVKAINQVNDVATSLQNDMEKLGKEAQAIGGVMTVITDIADQTNLLALNAAIEAARAGEAGRGFAVVADEVRKLAEKTMEATKEVGDNIRVIQSATETTVRNVNNAVENVSEATELANNSGQALAQIVHMTSSTSDLISGIAAAAEQQSATSEEINNAIEDVNRVVAETTDGMVQSSMAVQELAKMAQELKTVLDNLSSN